MLNVKKIFSHEAYYRKSYQHISLGSWILGFWVPGPGSWVQGSGVALILDYGTIFGWRKAWNLFPSIRIKDSYHDFYKDITWSTTAKKIILRPSNKNKTKKFFLKKLCKQVKQKFQIHTFSYIFHSSWIV